MGLPNYPRPAFVPSGLGLRFGLAQRGPGYCIGRATSLNLAIGLASPFFKPYQLALEGGLEPPSTGLMMPFFNRTGLERVRVVGPDLD